MDKIGSFEDYLVRKTKFREELEYLREIVQSCPLEETIKWGIPCYVYKNKNVLGIAAFDEYIGIWFYQGALLADHNDHLMNAQEGKTKAMRQWRFSNMSEIIEHKDTIQLYIQESMLNFDQGKEIKAERNKPLEVPTEFLERLDKEKELKTAFESLTLTKKREYCEHISSAKRIETKHKRLDKIIPLIKAKVGLNDKYR